MTAHVPDIRPLPLLRARASTLWAPIGRSEMVRSIHRSGRARPLVGLDIQPGFIAAAQASVDGAVTIERGVSAELAGDVMRDGEVTDVDALAAALRALWRQHRALPRSVRIGVANARIVVRAVDIPPLEDPKQIAAAVRYVAAEELPMSVDSAILAFEPVGIVQTPDGPRLRVMLVVARREMVHAIVAAVRAAGLKPEGVDLSAFAMIRALGGSRPGSALYLSVGGITNLALVVDGACLFTRVSAVGLESMAVELADRRTLELAEGRRWIAHVGLQAPLADIAGDPQLVSDARAILVEGVRRLAGEVRASVEFHHGHGATATVDEAVVTGSALRIPGFVTALQNELELAVKPRTVQAGKRADPGLDLARMTVAAGLAVAAVGP